ncbi:EamA family transporter [Bacteroidales bacterium OttesenSCG-928-K03]|nr:EamA family transporter [Bacteroidales bacterium OttesenSCG-928-L14]MDL2240316.1 EamA family transporter [Bacteroidales bacterium OttesenSCG-928-K22]MDL2242880.1 EamA family transporter [Bacteroidales bacterium OttesenSCG-928-K03]
MYYLIITILTATAILLVFKIAGKYKANNLHLITINYFIAACLGTIISLSQGSDINYIHYDWFGWSVLYGIYFILGFLLFGYSTQKSGIASTAISSRVSVIIPVILGFLLFKEQINNYIIIGIAIAVIALILINLPSKNLALKNNSRNNWIMILPILVFFIIGINDSIIKIAQHYFIKNNDYSEFISSCFFFSSIGGFIIILINRLSGKKTKLSSSSIVLGCILGVINYINFYFLIKGLAQMNVSVFMPIYNVGVVVLSSLIGIIAFKEKLSKTNIIGIVLAVIAIILLTI